MTAQKISLPALVFNGFDPKASDIYRQAKVLPFSPSKTLVLLLCTTTLYLSGCASHTPDTTPLPPQVIQIPSISAPSGEFAEPDYESLIKTVKQQHGPLAAARVTYWANLIREGKEQQELEKLKATNQFFNGAQFLSDQEIWQQEDYWATPLEFLIKDAGDCEEFSIAKYLTLDFMGVDIDKMRITYVKAETLNQPHMVLAYYENEDSTPLILDNIDPRILTANLREDLTPVYSFNGKTLWLARTRNEQVESGNPEQMQLWRNLKKKINEDLKLPRQ